MDPAAGRFTTRDTIGIWGDPFNLGNGYAYVGNNPWTWVDPFGEEIEWVKGPGATDDNVRKAKKLLEDAKSRRGPDGEKGRGVEDIENLEGRKDRKVTIQVGERKDPKTGKKMPNSSKCDDLLDASDPKKGSDSTIYFDPNNKDKFSDGTERDPESSLVHEIRHSRKGADGERQQTRKGRETDATEVENEHRRNKGIPQREKYGKWKVKQFGEKMKKIQKMEPVQKEKQSNGKKP